MQEKEVYITPEVEIIEFDFDDVIITSDLNGWERQSGTD